MDHEKLWGGFCAPPDEARPARLVALDGRQRRPRGHPARPRVAAPRRRARRADVRRRHGHAARRPGAGAARVAGVAGRGPARAGRPPASSAWSSPSPPPPGWSAAGGPWVEPADAMKKVVWSETVVEGGRPVEQRLRAAARTSPGRTRTARAGAPTPTPTGSPRTGSSLAVPADQVAPRAAPGRRARASAPLDDWALPASTAASPRSVVAAAGPGRPVDGLDRAGLRRAGARSRAVTVGLPGPRGFGAAPPPTAVLEASDDGVDLPRVARAGRAGEPAAKAVPVRTVAFAAGDRAPLPARADRRERRGRRCRRLAEGVRLPPILRRVLGVPGLRVRAVRRAAACTRPSSRPASPPRRTTTPWTPTRRRRRGDRPGRRRRRDRAASTTTACCAGTRPPGTWRVLRLGASLTGQTNGPAPPEATGLEVDKLDGGAGAPLPRHLPRRCSTAPALDALLSDSIESGRAELHRPAPRAVHRAARLRPAAVAAGAGRATSSATPRAPTGSCGTTGARSPTSSRASTTARSRAEAHAPRADLLRRGARGPPSAARRRPGHAQPRRRADGRDVDVRRRHRAARARPTSPTSRARRRSRTCYGKPFTGAESMTAFHRPWSYTPRRLKHVADLELALGVTRFCIHTSPHQPTQVPPPGIGLAPFLGQAFIRTEPWAELAGPWIDYLARCSWLLNQGVPAVDVAVFIGEEAPVTGAVRRGARPQRPGRVRLRLRRPRRPRAARFAVDDGDLAAGETRYRVLYLGGSQRADDRARAAPPRGTGGGGRDRRRPASGRARRRWPTTTPSTRGSATGSGGRRRASTPTTSAAALAELGLRRRSSSRAPSCCGSAGGSAAAR